ncbi:hypothetical protein A0H81_06978 [Grifola frondosa]|uniref:Uncharacterized protein n=1 Tax=Grifola frondosa TaxID=5627 RepID=A0A1C7M9W1_GRIFR|nr:hypothetical protein A0H81_06978 [Grifola frondosa]
MNESMLSDTATREAARNSRPSIDWGSGMHGHYDRALSAAAAASAAAAQAWHDRHTRGLLLSFVGLGTDQSNTQSYSILCRSASPRREHGGRRSPEGHRTQAALDLLVTNAVPGLGDSGALDLAPRKGATKEVDKHICQGFEIVAAGAFCNSN